MKIHTLTAVLLLSVPVAFAQQQETPKSTAPSPAEPSASQSQTAAPPAAQTPTVADIMAKRLEEMQSHWDKMSKTKDPAERQKLMEEHRQKMQELSALMSDWRSSQGMMGGGPGMGMMGHGMMGHGQGMGMMGGGQGMGMMQGCPMMQHQQQVEQRLDTIQKLLEQLVAQQGKS